MGVFQTLCNLLSIIGKKFSDAGFRDIAVDSRLITYGFITSTENITEENALMK